MHPDSSLPDRWVEEIWREMRATYGASFDRQWECPAGVDPVENIRQLKAHWGRELARFQQSPKAIRFGLDNLPTDHPPNLLQFKAICNRKPDSVPLSLPAPKADPQRVKAVLEPLRAGASSPSARAMAEALQKRVAAGDKITMAQRDFMRLNLGGNDRAPESD